MAVGYIRGKSAIKIHREIMRQKRQFIGMHLLALGVLR